MIRQVLTVCIGNICRSPVAQVLLAHQLPGLAVQSAGLGALVGRGADPAMLRLLTEQQLDGTAHRAQSLASWMLTQSDLVLVMEQGHKDQIEAQYPQARGRVFRLGHYDQQDIPDPYRQDDEVFRQVYQQIEAGVRHWADRIRKLGYQPTA